VCSSVRKGDQGRYGIRHQRKGAGSLQKIRDGGANAWHVSKCMCVVAVVAGCSGRCVRAEQCRWEPKNPGVQRVTERGERVQRTVVRREEENAQCQVAAESQRGRGRQEKGGDEPSGGGGSEKVAQNASCRRPAEGGSRGTPQHHGEERRERMAQ